MKQNRIGKTFGSWTILSAPKVSYPKESYGMCRYKCRCICGTVKNVFATSLLSGRSKSCGCLKLNRKKPYESLYNAVKRRVLRIQKEFKLTFEEFIEFTKIDECHYCGEPIKWAKHSINVDGVGSNLDRKNNSQGYSKKNCVVCCGGCNRTKGDRFTYEEFMLLSPIIRQIKNTRLKGL
jgi:5-methylcytosine-specific restriction endonuclease McrA